MGLTATGGEAFGGGGGAGLGVILGGGEDVLVGCRWETFGGGGVFLVDDVGSLTGVLFQVCLGGGLTFPGPQPPLGGGFIPLGISTISPVAFLYFSALAGQGHTPAIKIQMINPQIEIRDIPAK
ncbi:MAG: hypothetical protein V2B13_00335 [Pseudomonadota bacterium]